jgi:uncharacterized protein YukE
VASNPYDSRRLVLPPVDINQAFDTASSNVTDMAASITAVNNAVSGIPWDGASQQDMEQVWDKWMNAVTNLLGTEKDPSKGSINVVLTSLAQASGNYSAAEQELKAAFTQMQDNLANPASGQAGGPTSVLAQTENGDPNALSTFVEEIYSDSGLAAEGPWTISG